MRFPPWSSFYFRSTYAEREDADIPNLPHELNPYERFVIRWMFSEAKVLLLILVPAGVTFALMYVNSPYLDLLAPALWLPLGAGLVILLSRNRP